MKQSRIESAIETFANYASGFLLAFLVYDYIVLPAPSSFRDSAFWVTSLFTVVSVCRSYAWRRFFNAELHKLVHKTVGRIVRWLKINTV